jgi:Uncharacterised protein family (UPF0153).
MARKQLEKLDALTAQLPKINCQKKCQECCGPVLMSKLEWERIIEAMGFTPEAREDLTCPMLCESTGLCRAYAIRPVICRLWGLVEKMKCPFGCVPERWLTDAESSVLLKAARDLCSGH